MQAGQTPQSNSGRQAHQRPLCPTQATCPLSLSSMHDCNKFSVCLDEHNAVIIRVPGNDRCKLLPQRPPGTAATIARRRRQRSLQ